MKLFLFFVLLLFQTFAVAQEKKLNPFQRQIDQCGVQLDQLSEIKNFSQIYEALKKKYILVSERIAYKELVYFAKAEKRKIKVTNDSIELFKIDEQSRHVAIENPSKQKFSTIRGAIRQITLNQKIESDWEKSVESREGGLQIELVRDNEKLNQITIHQTKTGQKLECLVVKQSEICICNK